MKLTNTDNLGGALDTIVDTFTRAHGDHSGLASTVSDYMGRDGAPGIPVIRERAEAAGLSGLLEHWRQRTLSTSMSEDIITTLIPEAEIERFSKETGLTRRATINALAEIMPLIAYKNAERARRAERHAAGEPPAMAS